MDPITAWALATAAVAEMVTEIIKGQDAEARKQVWDWWIEDQRRLRKFFKIDD